MMITRGLPASGKSTWAAAQLKTEPDRWKRVNKDDLRAMLDGGAWSPEREKFVDSVQSSTVLAALDAGFDVIVDNTHLNPRSVKKLHELARQRGDVLVVERVFNVDRDACVARDSSRPKPVGEAVIDQLWRKHVKGRAPMSDRTEYHPPPVPQSPAADLPEAIICDLDGTLALLNGRDPYDASRCDNDLPSEPVLRTLLWAHEKGLEIIFVSGRMDRFRAPTELFLQHHVVTGEGLPVPYQLHMRRTGDSRSDTVVKREIYDAHVRDRYRVLFVMDDRPKVVRMWRRELGLTTYQLDDREF